MAKIDFRESVYREALAWVELAGGRQTVCASVHNANDGPAVRLPPVSLRQWEWEDLKRAVDHAFDEYKKRWPK